MIKNKTSITNTVLADLYLTIFFGTICLFFTGILISQINNFNQSIRVPIVYLVVATSSFIFATIIYANSTRFLASGDLKKTRVYLKVADSISEFLGIYLFIAAIPMVINAITQDVVLRVIIVLVTIVCLALYNLSSFSIFRRNFGNGLDRVFTLVLVIGMVIMYFFQFRDPTFFIIAGMTVALIILLATIMSDEKRVLR